ncbi:MAG: VapC toxin family PIN domain ribonuclease, partial [Calditrichia bacterium]|nr:VapC toxin family PIN domain ribonuclease [Calditrichia bacterium]
LLNILAVSLRTGNLDSNIIKEIFLKARNHMQGREYFPPYNQVISTFENSTCSAYDCEFVALAKEKNIKLITADKKILNEFPEYTKSFYSF